MQDADAMTSAAIALARMDAHERTCTERYGTIAQALVEIKATLTDNGRKLENATQRIHERIDGTAAEARANSGLALAAANKAEAGLPKVKVWALTGILGAIVSAAITLAVALVKK